jgi:hypothetical protein
MSHSTPAIPLCVGFTPGRARASRVILAFPFAIAALALPVHAAESCDALYNASIKALQTPHHVYSTKTLANGTKAPGGESIYAAGREYVLIGGAWKRSPMTPQDMIEAAQDKLKTHPDVCTTAGTETINGQAVTVYKVHNNESDTDSLVRVLTSSGLLLGQTLTLPDGAHMEIRYEYAHVQPPAGVG